MGKADWRDILLSVNPADDAKARKLRVFAAADKSGRAMFGVSIGALPNLAGPSDNGQKR
jgi:hypothetical protein